MPTNASRPFTFSGLWVPLITPFRDGKVDHPALADLTRSLSSTGIAGVVVCGSTGEAASLDAEEQLACLQTVADHAGALPLVMGMSGYHLEEARRWVVRLSEIAGKDVPSLAGLLIPAPHYVRPSQDGLLQWFRVLADASGLPLIVYDIPYRTGVRIERETMLSLAGHANIHAVKDCGGDLGKTLALISDGRLSVLAGEDLQIFATMVHGGTGAIAASAHVRTERFVKMMNAIATGDLLTARTIWSDLVPMIEMMFSQPNPGPIKAWLASEGRICDELRAPMTAATPELRQQLVLLAQRYEPA